MTADRKPPATKSSAQRPPRTSPATSPQSSSGKSGDGASPAGESPPKRAREAWESEFDDSLESDAPTHGGRERTSVVVESPEGRSWRIAASIVNKLRPVPRLVWPIVHAVFGKPGEIGQPDAMMFSAVGQVIQRAAQDKSLAPLHQEGVQASLAQSIAIIGPDVAAAVCLVHAVCRRIYSVMPERVARPIIDDALLRTHLGFYVGSMSPAAGAGRGMIAGFAGRCGLAVQIAAGDTEQAQRALTGLASGKDMTQVCSSVYGCDPLEVAALALISGGCCREIAFGISSYSSKARDVQEGTEQHRWLTLFSVIEGLRMGQGDRVDERAWKTLKYDAAGRENLNKQIVASQRRGHGWQWMTQALMGGSAEPAREPRSRSTPEES